MYKTLKYWIAQSVSWQSYIDFQLPKEAIAKYKFIEEYDDFYLSLMSNAFDILENENIDKKKQELIQLAKGIEIYSLMNKKEHFNGIDFYKNILYVAGLYYLADYSASAFLLSKTFEIINYTEPINIFLSCFLRREFSDNIYCNSLKNYIQTGKKEYLESLHQKIENDLFISIKSQGLPYLSFLLAKRIIQKFENNNIWSDLLKFNTNEYWKSFVTNKINKSIPIWDFFPSQRKAIFNDIFEQTTTTIQMPTSAGKTAICELIIYDEFKKNPSCKILYLAPFRALASELKNSLGNSLRNHDIKVKSIYGGNIPTQEEKIAIENTNLLISTPEKFIAIEDIYPELVDDFTTIICDEGHLIDDENRGLSYELLLTRLKSNKRFVYISAIIPNIEIINNWLGGSKNTIISSNYRPTKLDFAFLRQTSYGYLLDINPTNKIPDNYKLNKFIVSNDDDKKNDEYRFLNSRTGNLNKYKRSEKTLSVTCALKSLPFGTVALFAATKGEKTGVRGLVKEIIKQTDNNLKFPKPQNFANQPHLKKLKEYFTVVFGKDYLLTKATDYGVLFHYGDLPQLIREIVEKSIRNGNVKLVVCTNTLAEGVNLPIKTIILYSVTRSIPIQGTKKWKKEKISLRDLKNLVGRAGRAGQETKGLIIATNKQEYDYIKKLIKEEDIENVNGYLFDLVQNITEVVQKQKITLSNELFEYQDEYFLQLIDLIDKSIIHLINLDTKIENIEKQLNLLIENTLSFYQSNKKQKETLKTIFNLRSKKIIPFIEEKKFYLLKQTDCNIREYSDIEELFNIEDEILTQLEDPLSSDWLDFILDNFVFKLKHIKYEIDQYKLNNIDLRNAIICWLNGSWYENISKKLNKNIDDTLKLVKSLVCYKIQNSISNALKYAENILIEKEIELSPEVLNWSQYLLYGVKTQLELDLIELGFNDRVSIIQLTKNINQLNYQHNDLKKLKYFLIMNENKLLKDIKTQIPQLSFEYLKNNFDGIHY